MYIDTDTYNTEGRNILSLTHKIQILANVNNYKDSGICKTWVKKALRSLNVPSLLPRFFLAVVDLLWPIFCTWGLRRSMQGIIYTKQDYFDHEMFLFLPWYLYSLVIFFRKPCHINPYILGFFWFSHLERPCPSAKSITKIRTFPKGRTLEVR